ncbi:exostosin domain-containing protein [Polluticaenibacter yanchengensis]|uniref:Exostosin family protein n=1 Tax=Polluticaenibacter yanchengensis TaxID=3014562 RepID=A0ABT4UKD6_9BACT|nr:exostosin family protein [Chitinophagaceae bacterium LY-5]
MDNKIKLFIYNTKDSGKDLFPIYELLKNNDKTLQEFYEIVGDVSQADFIILKNSVNYILENQLGKSEEIINFSKQHNKKLLYFCSGDFGSTLKDPNAICIRLGGFKSKYRQPTFIMPSFIDDPKNKTSQPQQYISKPEKPTIGFVGHAYNSTEKYLKEFIAHFRVKYLGLKGKFHDKQSFYPSSIKRYDYLKILENTPGIICNFIYRKQYNAGSSGKESFQKTRNEYYDNINENLFTFCIRGGGNYSVRFYDTIGLGRIPLQVNTDCKMPFEDRIDWSKHILCIEEKDIKNMPRILADFYNSRSAEELKEMQLNNRLLWEKYLTKTNYFVELSTDLKKLL